MEDSDEKAEHGKHLRDVAVQKQRQCKLDSSARFQEVSITVHIGQVHRLQQRKSRLRGSCSPVGQAHWRWEDGGV